MNVTIIGRNNSGGLEKDKLILTDLLLQNGMSVDFWDLDNTFIPVSEDTDLCIHLEIVNEQYFGRRNILIPNQEWFYREWLQHLDRFDAVFCKSVYAANLFRQHHNNVKYTGFTSLDCYQEGDKLLECFHSSGSSKAKGTSVLVEALREYSYSRFHIVSSLITAAPFDNDHLIFHGTLPEKAYNDCRNRCLVHIYPSMIEGFGHAINEAKACGAVVLTTDYPPMNELTSDFLIPFAKEYVIPGRLGGIVELHPLAIQASLQAVLHREDLQELGRSNRLSFLQNDQLFREQFMHALLTL
ncbi:glycosyltransferase [Chitinophaga rhizophila]|uniref:Glycosyltransferase n=1 Tax=Chitinophaga rhizophila TaxID=2866212 RepID=A0ABS7GEA8_9BACT|nr:glycosyltransferase [Chitinophaga rhizophila]MBW8686007.1 glycosyltransferase [Chitinophaga rhizophila]